MEIQTYKVYCPSHPYYETKFLKKVNALRNRKVMKDNNIQIDIALISEFYHDANNTKEYEITVSHTENFKSAYIPVGCVTVQEDLTIFETIRPDVSLKQFKNVKDLRCEVCNKTHSKRSKMFVFEKEGSLVTLGSQCAKPISNIERVISNLNTFVVKHSKENLSSTSGNYYEYYNTKDVVDAISHVYCNISDKYISHKYAGERTPTSSQVRTLLDFDLEVDSLVKIKSKLARSMSRSFLQEMLTTNSINVSFFDSLDVSLFDDEGKLRDTISPVNIGGLSFLVYKLYNKLDQKNAPVSSYIGNVGEPLSVELSDVTITEQTSYQFSYYGTTSYLVKGKDSKGNSISFFTSSVRLKEQLDNGNYSIIGKVSQHKSFGQTCVTCLKSVKSVKK